MFTGRQEALFLTALIAVTVAAAAADDKVEFKGSTSFELPKPSRNVESGRTYNGGEKEKPDMSGGYVPPVAPNSPLVDKKFKEMMDKKKNWIYLNPYKDNFDSKTAEFMKGEKGTALFDQRWMTDKEEKGTVEKFLTEKQNRHDDDLHRDSDKDENDADRAPRRDSGDIRGLGADGGDKGDNVRQEDVIRFGSKDEKIGAAGINLRTAGEKGFTERLERTPRFIGEQRTEMTAIEKEKVKQDQKTRDSEFGQLLQSISPSASGLSLPGAANPLTPSLNLGGPDASQNAGRPSQSVTFGRGETPGFNFGSSGNSPVSANLSPANRGFDDFAPKAAAKPSVFAPPSNPLPSAGPPPVAPFQFTFPQRKF
jgi:hypothetical protein